jgi:hypothetical protein
MNLLSLKKKLFKFDILVFDLDDTIYPQKNYDTPALLSVSRFIQKKTNLKILDIFNTLRKLKKIRRGKPPNFLFNIFFKNIKIKYKNYIIDKCVRLFQSYKCKELKIPLPMCCPLLTRPPRASPKRWQHRWRSRARSR